MRHKWDKYYYNGKLSSFEIRAFCKVCGCAREKRGMRYEYELKGVHYDTAPPCEVLHFIVYDKKK